MAITEFCAYCGKIYFYVNMKLLAEMPKITKCLKCLKLRYSVDFNKSALNKPQRIRKLIFSISLQPAAAIKFQKRLI